MTSISKKMYVLPYEIPLQTLLPYLEVHPNIEGIFPDKRSDSFGKVFDPPRSHTRVTETC